MKTNIVERLNNINIDNLVNYLLDHNWKQIPLKRDYGVYAFRSENESGKCSVFIPKSKDIDKYERELLSNLIKICERDDLHLGTFIDYLIKDHSPIYTITCMEKFEEKIFEDGRSSGFPTYGSTAFMGFYHDFNDAVESVIENACDINEHCYNYAVVEEILPGLYSYPRPRWFYKFNREKNEYEPIEEPKFMNHIANVL